MVLLVHDHHGHPLVSCEYHPHLILSKLLYGPVFFFGDVGFVVRAVVLKKVAGICSQLICLHGTKFGTGLLNCCYISLPGGYLGVMAKLGPLDSRFLHWSEAVLDRFITHFSLVVCGATVVC